LPSRIAVAERAADASEDLLERCTGPPGPTSPEPTASSRLRKAYFGSAVSKRESVRK
jgi:hypothetical protein